MRLLWLPGVLRAAGLTVHEVSGWKTRGSDSYGPVRGITCHATAGSRNSTDEGEIRVLLNGSNTAPPPIAQLYLGRQGHWWVVASGLCFHNKIGWGGPNAGYGNDSLLGIEAANNNSDEPWPKVQYESYVCGVAALVKHQASGYSVTLSRVAGHKEHQPGNKSDPTFSMPGFRADVSQAMKEADVDPNDVKQIWKWDPGVDGDGIKNPYASYPTNKTIAPITALHDTLSKVHELRQSVSEMKTTLAAILEAATGDTDTDAILARIDEVAAAESERDSQLRLLVEKAQNGQLDADEVVRRMGMLLSTATA